MRESLRVLGFRGLAVCREDFGAQVWRFRVSGEGFYGILGIWSASDLGFWGSGLRCLGILWVQVTYIHGWGMREGLTTSSKSVSRKRWN